MFKFQMFNNKPLCLPSFSMLTERRKKGKKKETKNAKLRSKSEL